MAHFLSEVTHQRLEQREGTDETLFSAGVTVTHDFECQARCVEVVPTQSGDGALADVVIWTGNIDGSVVIRRGLDGEPVATIAGKKNIFVYSLLTVGSTMWAGQSDGYITVFDLRSADRLCEIKGHIGAVNAMLAVDDAVFTCGSDWQICRWDPNTMSRVAHGQFSGHQNAVRCLISEPGILYSGGDDNCIRAWDLTSGLEKAAPWPIVAHDNAVRALAIHEVYLFSSSTDGTIKTWNTQTAQLVRQLDQREAAVNTLLFDRPNVRLWSGATDGTVCLWDASNLTLVGQINTHHNTHVALIKEIARVNAVKAWTISADGVVRTWYCDTDPMTTDFVALADMEASFQQEIETHRTKIIDNYRELENAKLKLQELEALDQRKKVLVGETFGRAKANELKAVYHAQALHFLHKQQRRHHQQVVASAMEARNWNIHRSATWQKLVIFTQNKKEQRRKQGLVLQLQRIHSSNLRRVYVNNVIEHGRRLTAAAFRAKIASGSFAASARATLLRFYCVWRRCVQRRKLLRKRAEVASAIVNRNDAGLAAVYWARLEKFTRCERQQANLSKAVAILGRSRDEALMSYYFRQLQRFVLARAAARQQQAVARSLISGADGTMCRIAYQKWAGFAKLRRSREALANVTSQRQLIADMEARLAASAQYTEAQLEQELRIKQMELATILQGNRELDLDIRELEARNKALQRDLLKDVTLEMDKPPLDVLGQAMHFLKARSVNVFHDLDTIQKAREAAKVSSPSDVYEDGVATVRKACQAAVRPHRLKEKDSYDWMVGDLFQKISKRGLGNANTGICRLVTAYDMLNTQQLNAWLSKDGGDVRDPWGPKHKHNNEVLGNFGVFLEVAIRQYRIRRNEDPLTGVPLEPIPDKSPRGRSRSGSPRGRSRSTSAKPAPKRTASAPAGSKPKPKRGASAAAGKAKPAAKSAKPRAKSAPAGNRKPKGKRAASAAPGKPAPKRAASAGGGKPRPKSGRAPSAAAGSKPRAKVAKPS